MIYMMNILMTNMSLRGGRSLPDEAIFSYASEDCFAPTGLAMTGNAALAMTGFATLAKTGNAALAMTGFATLAKTGNATLAMTGIASLAMTGFATLAMTGNATLAMTKKGGVL